MLSPRLGALRMGSPTGLIVNLLLLVNISSPTEEKVREEGTLQKKKRCEKGNMY